MPIENLFTGNLALGCLCLLVCLVTCLLVCLEAKTTKENKKTKETKKTTKKGLVSTPVRGFKGILNLQSFKFTVM